MREYFDKQLAELNCEMRDMGNLCEAAVAKAVKALLSCDRDMARELPELLTKITRNEQSIEAGCLRLLLHQQPVARDLRTVSAAMKMVTDLNRIGIQSANLADIVAGGTISSVPEALPLHKMAEAVIRMVTDSISAFVKQDEAMADAVVSDDDVVDNLFCRCKDGIIELIRRQEASGETLVDLLIIVRYLERIGDHAVNIALWAKYSVTGELGELT